MGRFDLAKANRCYPHHDGIGAFLLFFFWSILIGLHRVGLNERFLRYLINSTVAPGDEDEDLSSSVLRNININSLETSACLIVMRECPDAF